MKILFLNTNIGYGGASKIMAWLANLYANNGHEVIFVTYRNDRENQKLGENVKHIHLDLEKSDGGRSGFLKTIKTLRDYIKSNDFDWAIGFLTPSILRLSLACKGTKTKTLFSQRGDPYLTSENLVEKLKKRISDKIFCTGDAFVFQTTIAKSYYPLNVQQRSLVIANPIIYGERTMTREGNILKTIACVGRLDIRQKRQDLLIDAFNMISGKYPDYLLEFYGDGPDEYRLKEMAMDNPNIRFMGKTKNVVEAIQNAAISVLSSDFEGVPNSLLESMSIGVPCIATDCSPGGAAMLIDNGSNGLLVPRRDAKALAEAMMYFIEHPDLAEQMGKKGMEDVNIKYSEEKISLQWLGIFSDIL